MNFITGIEFLFLGIGILFLFILPIGIWQSSVVFGEYQDFCLTKGYSETAYLNEENYCVKQEMNGNRIAHLVDCKYNGPFSFLLKGHAIEDCKVYTELVTIYGN